MSTRFFPKNREDFLWTKHGDGSNWYYMGRKEFLQLELASGQKYYYNRDKRDPDAGIRAKVINSLRQLYAN